MSQKCRRTPENVLGGHKMFCECPGVAQDIDTPVDCRFDSNFCSWRFPFRQNVIFGLARRGKTYLEWYRSLGTAWQCSQAWGGVLLLSKFGDGKFVDRFDHVSWCISFVDRVDHVARARYFWYVDSGEGRILACISLRGSIGIRDANVTQARRARHRFDAWGDSQGARRDDEFPSLLAWHGPLVDYKLVATIVHRPA